ncbi:MAG TPA: CTP synthase [Candidatus Saccharimonadales bacterium]
MKSPTRYIFITGGVLSGIGKGITASAIGAVFKARGFSVTMQKCDPYLNIDAGTLNPAEHGECFVTKDGAETDLDLGHYERFLDADMNQKSATLTGRLIRDLINDERSGKFLGKTIQLVPHLTGAIQQSIVDASKGSSIHIVEIGGTVGDYEGLAHLEAIREFAQARPGKCQFVHVLYVPFIDTTKEFKTKPAQNSIRDLRQFGIVPDFVAVRAEQPTTPDVRAKISLFGGVPAENVIMLENARTVYQVPLTLEQQHIGRLLSKRLGLPIKKAYMQPWRALVKQATATYAKTVHIGIVAKYLNNEDTYYSVIEALKAAAWHEGVNLQYTWVSAEHIEKAGTAHLAFYDGLLVPGGFGIRGVEGKIAAADYALEHKKPYLGICLGLQVAVVAAARRGGLAEATTAELDPDAKKPVVYIMADQKGKEATGGTMRLGDYACILRESSLAKKTYGKKRIIERHRHRYEVNIAFQKQIEAGGLIISGTSPDGTLVEVVEAKHHPYMLATQAHPEFSSCPMRPYAPFIGLIRASVR